MSEIDVTMCCFYWAGGCEEGGITKKCSDRNCYYKQLQQLKAENEELKNQIKGEINATQKWYQEHTNEKFKANKYKQCLDEIEEYCNKYGQNSIGFKKKIQAIIKKAKEGEE